MAAIVATLAFSTVFAAITLADDSNAESGTDGYYTWDLTGGTLTISANIPGVVIPNFASASGTPWYTQRANIETVIITDGIVAIGNYAFSSLTNLLNVQIAPTVKHIGSYAFYQATSLSEIVLPTSVTYVGERAFGYCSSLNSVILPDSIVDFGINAFQSCTSLVNVTLPQYITTIPSSLFTNCTSLKSIVIPTGVTEIGSAAFNACSSLTSVILPDSLTTIRSNAFSSTALTSIIIPSSMITIDANWISNSFFLTDVWNNGTYTSYASAWLLVGNSTNPVSATLHANNKTSLGTGEAGSGTVYTTWTIESFTPIKYSYDVPSTATRLNQQAAAGQDIVLPRTSIPGQTILGWAVNGDMDNILPMGSVYNIDDAGTDIVHFSVVISGDGGTPTLPDESTPNANYFWPMLMFAILAVVFGIASIANRYAAIPAIVCTIIAAILAYVG